MLRNHFLLGLTLLSVTPAVARIPADYPVIANAPADPLAYRALTLSAKRAFDAGDCTKLEALHRQTPIWTRSIGRMGVF